jgi:hypothetical protein
MIDATEGVALADFVPLDPRETAGGRGFTAPAHTAGDLAAVGRMLDTVRREVARAAGPPADPRPRVLEGREADGRAHRTIVCDARRLGAGRDLTWVGFFAEKRRDRDPSPLTVMDDELIREFPAHPDILSYSSLELANGDWGNLILLAGDAAREHWRVSERHAFAARELAPRHYMHVRLHLGLLPGGVLGGRPPVLSRTRYYDYQDDATWRAERALAP